jgi:MFS family permease
MSKEKIITKTILIIGLISLFNDISSEMLYPIMPVYLKSIGFGALVIGILEGFAEAVAGIGKGFFGKLSDQKGIRIPFVRLGYSLSSLSKPMLAMFANIGWVFSARFMDKLGKGVRTGARDAFLSSITKKEHKGKVFGFRQGMDTVGAAIGPVIALIYLFYYPGNYRFLFLIAFAPALIGVMLTFFIKETPVHTSPKAVNLNPFAFIGYWKGASKEFKRIVIGFFAFTLINSTDMLLLLMAKSTGFTDLEVIEVYIFYNIIFALASYPIGHLADKIGMKTMFIFGMILFALVYLGMAKLQGISMLYILFFMYGIYAACNDGIIKAWISKITPKEETGTAIGFFSAISSILTLLASSIAGLLWVVYYPQLTFIVSGIGALLIAGYFFGITTISNKNNVLKKD